MSRSKAMTDDELVVLTDSEIRDAFGYGTGKLEQMRRKALQYFFAEPRNDLAPPEIEGRSSYVDTTVRDTVLGMMAPLIKTFCGGENVVEFEATTEADEDKAKQATDYLNYLLRKKNPGYSIVTTWIIDALIQKNGIIKVWWDNSEIKSREEYRGQTPVDLAVLMDDPEIEIIDQKSYPDEEAAEEKEQTLKQMQGQLQQMAAGVQQKVIQAQQQQAQGGGQPASAAQAPAAGGMPPGAGQPPPVPPEIAALQQATQQFEQFKAAPPAMLYDLTVQRVKKGGKLCIENVPPEEFLICKDGKTIPTARFCGHRMRRTLSYLRSAGYKNVDDIAGDSDSADTAPEAIERNHYINDETDLSNSGLSADESQREVWITECYMQADVDGDGIAEWRKIVRGGNQVLENVECDGPPFVSICPNPLPHSFFGMGQADLAMEPQRIKTVLTRAQLDNISLQVNGRYFAIENQVNLDDLLNNRPGGVVRVKSAGAVGRLDQGAGDAGQAMGLMQYFQDAAEESTGWSRQSQGGNGEGVDQTATETNIVTNRADSRVEIIARNFAETGFTDLFKLMLKLVCQYQDKAETVKLGNKWANIDPREWTNQFDLTINVGLGTGNKDQLVKHLMVLMQQQAQGLAIGVADKKNVYNANIKLAESLGFKNGDQFFHDPDAPPDPNAPPPAPPPPDPAIVAIQEQGKQHMAELQMKAQQAEADRQQQAQLEPMKAQIQAQAQMQTDRNRQESEAEQQRLKIQYQSELDAMREQNRNAEETRKHDLEQQRLMLDQYKIDKDAETKIIVAQITAKQQGDAALMAAEQQANEGYADDT